jgi:protein-S-isoprenylcysteine O-methyltransferase Ste14
MPDFVARGAGTFAGSGIDRPKARRPDVCLHWEIDLQELVNEGFEWAWGGLTAYWLLSARHAKVAKRSMPVVVHVVVYLLPLVAAFHLLQFDGDETGLLGVRFVPDYLVVQWLGLSVTVAGVSIACWSRYILGRNWSGGVQIKEDHELIERGPYRHVRHPIYTGLLLAVMGTALGIGELRGLFSVAIVASSFWIKLRNEERWLKKQFGDTYVRYMRRTKALFPGLL